MATKYQFMSDMYEYTLGKMTETPNAWIEFLRSACRNYKCRFDEQVLIFAQRPDATAVLEIEKWNIQFGRWVNKGAKGIAVFDEKHPGNKRLRHYFDVSDTHGSQTSRPVPIWQGLCQFATLKYQQMDGLNTVMPYGVRRIDALRTLTNEKCANSA